MISENNKKIDDIEEYGDRKMPRIYTIFAILISIGAFLFVLGSEEIKIQAIRFLEVVIGLILCYVGTNRSVRYRKPSKVLPALLLSIVGGLLILYGLGLITIP